MIILEFYIVFSSSNLTNNDVYKFDNNKNNEDKFDVCK